MQLAASCGVNHGLQPWFSMHFKSIATFLAKSANEKNPFGRRKVASAECKLSVDHITITLAMWRRLGACMQCLASAGPQLQHERGGAYWQTKALPNLAIVTKFSPLPEPCDNGKTTTCGSVYRAKSVNGEVDGSGRP